MDSIPRSSIVYTPTPTPRESIPLSANLTTLSRERGSLSNRSRRTCIPTLLLGLLLEYCTHTPIPLSVERERRGIPTLSIGVYSY